MSLSILANKEQNDRFHHCRCRKKVMRSKLKMSIFIGWKNSWRKCNMWKLTEKTEIFVSLRKILSSVCREEKMLTTFDYKLLGKIWNRQTAQSVSTLTDDRYRSDVTDMWKGHWNVVLSNCLLEHGKNPQGTVPKAEFKLNLSTHP